MRLCVLARLISDADASSLSVRAASTGTCGSSRSSGRTSWCVLSSRVALAGSPQRRVRRRVPAQAAAAPCPVPTPFGCIPCLSSAGLSLGCRLPSCPCVYLWHTQWGIDRKDMVDEVGLKRFDLAGCRVELRSDAKASSKGYRPRFKLVHPERTITFEAPSGGVPFGEIKEAVAAWSSVLMSAIKKANMGAEGAALRGGQTRSAAESAVLAERLMSQYDPDGIHVDYSDDDDNDTLGGGTGVGTMAEDPAGYSSEGVAIEAQAQAQAPLVAVAVFEAQGALGMKLGAEEIGGNELPPGWSTSRDESGRTMYLVPRTQGGGTQYERPKSHEHQAAVIQGITQGGLVAAGQYYEKHSTRVNFLAVGMVLDAVNGDSIAGVPFRKVLERIKGAGRPLELTFHETVEGEEESFSPRKDADAASLLPPRTNRAGGQGAGTVEQQQPPPPSSSLFNRRVSPTAAAARARGATPTIEVVEDDEDAMSSAPSTSSPGSSARSGGSRGGVTGISNSISMRRVRAATAGREDYDHPEDDAGHASDDDAYVDAATELQSFHSLQGSAELLVKKKHPPHPTHYQSNTNTASSRSYWR